jgi:hypothetical protein
MEQTCKCRYCGRPLTWLPRFRHLEFCSEEHQSCFQTESDLQTVNRLLKSGPEDQPPVSLDPAL